MLELDQVNIKDLTIEAPQKPPRLPFDPELDITETDWDYLLSKESSIAGLEAMKLLSPDRYKKTHVDQIMLYASLSLSLHQSRFDKNPYDLIRDRKHLKILFPEKTTGLFFSDYQQIGELIAIKRYLSRSRKFMPDHLHSVVAAEIVVPGGIKQLKSVKKLCEDGFNWANQDGDIRNRPDWPGVVVNLKLLDQDRFTVELTREDWQRLHLELEKSRDSWKYAFFANLAWQMTVLAAHSAQVTPEGIEVVMHNQNPPTELRNNMDLPLRRNF